MDFLFFQKDTLLDNVDPAGYKPFHVFQDFLGKRGLPTSRISSQFPKERFYWIKQREIMKKALPLFHQLTPGQHYFDLIWKKSDYAVDSIVEVLNKNPGTLYDWKQMDILVATNQYVAAVTKKFMFGDVLKCLEQESPAEDFATMFLQTQDACMSAVEFRLLVSMASTFLPFPLNNITNFCGDRFGSINRKYQSEVQNMMKYARRAISYARDLSSKELKQKKDLCSIFLTDTMWDDELLVRLLFSTYIAGRNNIFGLLSWSFYYLADNSDVQEKLYSELDQYLKHNKLNNFKEISAVDVDKLPYLNGVIREVDRLSHATVQVVSEAIKDFTYIDGTKFPKGTRFTISPYAYGHLNSNYKQPEKFNPERWIKNDEAVSVDDDPFIMFRQRNRSCLGKHFGIFQAKFRMDEAVKNDVTKKVAIHLYLANKSTEGPGKLKLRVTKRRPNNKKG
eukprot:snap_masked-scaffold_6-processed-gene-2.8-mRNA-1 protein AED:1.00 eAED:1.00 QI:0/0/0/0/1/1/2/0/449